MILTAMIIKLYTIKIKLAWSNKLQIIINDGSEWFTHSKYTIADM